ncbi:MAG: alpha-galactosidase [Ignavibacteriales bacterium]|nr:alpha-galactosidase [Ignavibacteriales bacterium]
MSQLKRNLMNRFLKMGLWFSPMGIDSTTERYQKYPNWVIKIQRIIQF